MEHRYKWYKLDNAAKLYPSITNSVTTNVFRMAAVMNDEVDPIALQEAVESLKERFSLFYVKAKRGLFWHYYEYNEKKQVVKEESPYVCSAIVPRNNNGYMFRVSYFNNRISTEFFHALTDGFGGVSYLKALIYRYLEIKGYEMSSDGRVITVGSNCNELENEDSYGKNYIPSKDKRAKTPQAFRIPGTKFGVKHGMGVISGRMCADDLVKLAKKYNSTVTEYICAVLTYCIYKLFLHGRVSEKPIKMFVPINVRRFYDSITLRNFTLYLYTKIKCDGKEWTIENILAEIKQQMNDELKTENIQKTLNANVAIEKNTFLSLVPLFIKNLATKIGYSKLGMRLATLIVSNVGVVEIPESMKKHIKHMEFVLAVEAGVTHNVTMITANGVASITFARNIYDLAFEKMFFRQLASEGIDVEIDSNLWEEKA